MVGGELKGYTELLTESRREAIMRMMQQAEQLGAVIYAVHEGQESQGTGPKVIRRRTRPRCNSNRLSRLKSA